MATKQTGTVKWFNSLKGYGFITPDGGGKDIYVHISQIGADAKPGQRFEFQTVEGRKGLQAVSVRPEVKRDVHFEVVGSPTHLRNGVHAPMLKWEILENGKSVKNDQWVVFDPKSLNSQLPVGVPENIPDAMWAELKTRATTYASQSKFHLYAAHMVPEHLRLGDRPMSEQELKLIRVVDANYDTHHPWVEVAPEGYGDSEKLKLLFGYFPRHGAESGHYAIEKLVEVGVLDIRPCAACGLPIVAAKNDPRRVHDRSQCNDGRNGALWDRLWDRFEQETAWLLGFDEKIPGAKRFLQDYGTPLEARLHIAGYGSVGSITNAVMFNRCRKCGGEAESTGYKTNHRCTECGYEFHILSYDKYDFRITPITPSVGPHPKVLLGLAVRDLTDKGCPICGKAYDGNTNYLCSEFHDKKQGDPDPSRRVVAINAEGKEVGILACARWSRHSHEQLRSQVLLAVCDEDWATREGWWDGVTSFTSWKVLD